MSNFLKKIVGGLALSSVAVIPLQQATAQDTNSINPSQFRELLLKTLEENPAILEQANAAAQARQREAEFAQYKTALSEKLLPKFKDGRLPVASFLDGHEQNIVKNATFPVMGKADADVTVVEFLDYNCGWCRRAHDPVKGMMKDANVRVMPVIVAWQGANARIKGRFAFAADAQGKFEEAHNYLFEKRVNFGGPRAEGSDDAIINQASVTAEIRQAAEALGLNFNKLKSDMLSAQVTAKMKASQEVASTMGVRGTPFFAVGDEISPGYVEQHRLMQMVSQVRSRATGR